MVAAIRSELVAAIVGIHTKDKIGATLPCNVVIQQREDGNVEISAVDPVTSMQAIANPALAETAEVVRDMSRKAVEAVPAAAA